MSHTVMQAHSLPKYSSRKRKRGHDRSSEQHEEHKDPLNIVLQEAPTGILSPVFAAFLPVNPPAGLEYKHYAKPPHQSQQLSHFDASYVHASSATVEYQSSNQMRYADVEAGYNSQYLIAVFNKRTHAVVLRPAKIHIISRHVKGLECLSTATQFTNTTLASMRKELSLAFGNAKQAKAVRDKEQRAIGAGAVGSTIKALQQGIQTAATSLPSREEIHLAASTNRPIPKLNQSATKAEEVYPLYDTVSQAELESIDVDSLLDGTLHSIPTEARTAYTKSVWHRSAGRLDQQQLQILVYIGYLIRFGQAAHFKDSRAEYGEKHKDVPSVVIDGFYSRFADKARHANARRQQTPETIVKLQTYAVVLALRLGEWVVDLELIAKDFRLEGSELVNNYDSTLQAHLMEYHSMASRCQGLGCRVTTSKVKVGEDATSVEGAKPRLRAELRLPLSFPKPKHITKH